MDGLEDTPVDLEEHGYTDPMEVAIAEPTQLATILRISETKAEKLIADAQDAVDSGGFNSGTEYTDPPDLSEVDVVPETEGWTLSTHSREQITWTTPSGYSLMVTTRPSEVPKKQREYVLEGTLPPEGDHNPQSTKKEERTVKSGFESASEVVGFAVGYMESHPLDFEQSLTEFTGIGDRTADYLLLEYGVHSHQDLYELWSDGVLKEIVNPSSYDEIAEELEDRFL